MKLSEHESNISLQDAFAAFRANKIRTMHQVKESAVSKNRSPAELAELRQMFLDELHKHVGIPYDRREHARDSDLFNAPYDLDCCGLVRIAALALEERLGIKFGLWNQAYMFDTLPIRYETTEKLKHGDLIFYEGEYYDTQKRQQKHFMTHVEVFEGTVEKPERCFASRWNDGVVQYFDSYKFVASPWKLRKIWFCSIDTWLDGTCVSVCDEHPWEIEVEKTNKHSIFYDESDYRAE